MMIDKPSIDRERILREEHRQKDLLRSLADAVRTLRPDERLGRPVRRGNELVIPIYRRRTTALPGVHSTN